ncbi:MAG: hypothetical protein ACFFBI_09155 [Promethearchaeota archaeon]
MICFKKTDQDSSKGGFKPLKMVILEIYFRYKGYIYIGFVFVIVPLIMYLVLSLWLITNNTKLLRTLNLIFLVIVVPIILFYFIFLLIHYTPIIRGTIIVTLVEMMVIIKGRVYLKVTWKDLSEIRLITTKILYEGLSKKGRKLEFYGCNVKQEFKLWCFSISRKNVKQLLGTIKKISKVNNIAFFNPLIIEEIDPYNAIGEFDNIRHFKKGY